MRLASCFSTPYDRQRQAPLLTPAPHPHYSSQTAVQRLDTLEFLRIPQLQV